MRPYRRTSRLADLSKHTVNTQLNERARRDIEDCLSEISGVTRRLNNILAFRDVAHGKAAGNIVEAGEHSRSREE